MLDRGDKETFVLRHLEKLVPLMIRGKYIDTHMIGEVVGHKKIKESEECLNMVQYNLF